MIDLHTVRPAGDELLETPISAPTYTLVTNVSPSGHPSNDTACEQGITGSRWCRVPFSGLSELLCLYMVPHTIRECEKSEWT